MKIRLGIIEIIAVIQILITFIPYIAYITPPGFNVIVSIVFFLLLVSTIGVGESVAICGQTSLILIFVIVDFLFSDERLLCGYKLIQYYSWCIFIKYIVKNNLYGFARFTLLLITLCFVTTMVTTIIGNEMYPGISREKAAGITVRDRYSDEVINGLNIGGFGFVYTIALFTPMLTYLIEENKMARWIIIVLLILTYFTIVKTEYTTALLISLVGLIPFIISGDVSLHKINRIFLFSFILIIFGSAVIAPYISQISSIFTSEVISIRFNEINSALSGSDISGSDFQGRLDKWSKSLESFFNNPLTGSSILGGHSFILDKLALYGIWGLLGVIVLLRSVYKQHVKFYYGTNLYGFSYLLFLMEIVLITMNTYLAYDMFLLIIPIFSYVFNNENNNYPQY